MRINLRDSLKQIQASDTFQDGLRDLRALGEQLASMQLQGLVFGQTFSRDTCAGYLADHLDAALDLADQIAAHSLKGVVDANAPDGDAHSGGLAMGGEAIIVRFGEIRGYVNELKTLELAFTSKISQARIWAERVQRYDPRLDRVAGLLLAGTHTLVDAGAAQADTTNDDFNQSDPTLFYLRSRGLIGDDVVSLDQVDALQSGYDFKVWGEASLFDVAEMMNAFLGAADVHYALYVPEDDDDGVVAAAADPVEAPSDTDTPTVESAEPVKEDDPAQENTGDEPMDDVPSETASALDDLADPVPVMGTLQADSDGEPAETQTS
ncbi:MAG: hypothetical protein ACR2O4_16270 [Hyphomicrobiaceae bacterium]